MMFDPAQGFWITYSEEVALHSVADAPLEAIAVLLVVILLPSKASETPVL
jgi:hypothetical protein